MPTNKKPLIISSSALAALVIFCVLCTCTPSTNLISSSASVPVEPGKEASATILSGMCFSPIRANQDPDCRVLPTKAEIQKDLDFILKARVTRRIRTYSSSGTLGQVPIISEKMGIECWPGAWLGKYREANEREIQSLIKTGKAQLFPAPH